jgi:hypothetical protein
MNGSSALRAEAAEIVPYVMGPARVGSAKDAPELVDARIAKEPEASWKSHADWTRVRLDRRFRIAVPALVGIWPSLQPTCSHASG